MIGPIFKGMATTLKHFFKPPVTIEYPEIKRPVRNRFKNTLKLHTECLQVYLIFTQFSFCPLKARNISEGDDNSNRLASLVKA